MSLRPLSKELQAKAIAELNEKPERIEEDIEYIKEWLRKQQHLNARLEDQLILNYLRGCKFSLEKTKAKFDSLYTLKGMLPEFFTNRDPFRKEIQDILKLGLALPLPKTSTPDGPRVMLLRSIPDPSIYKMEDVFKVNMMIGDIMVQEDDQYIVGGLVLFNDVSGAGVSYLTHMTPSLAKKSMTYYQDAYPTRPKELHFFNIPSFFDALLSIIKPFMKEKMQKRLRIHNTSRIEEMYQYIPKSILPTEYGGDAGPIQDLIDHWKKKVEDYAPWFKEDVKYVSDESRRLGKPKTASDLLGIEGSFRKLNVD
ncbi:alpha-tocopherol transfer protein-related [Holotrichia oblita]|uniref:Alpha-tocopherol transfer protein-related n=3 Tax=Holotrichia oblita TaxID=644536 RepID=A0ACB9TH61_HOLOL|nr:alpha-tocopherol transfer protein-related [Holotrichia oblita]KAI4466010.1 alpha-tocopherol transfer protein-related [Holotrichia oblita]KAI4466015.1 alpha-tocopherol transfer protein-related [Holotrichia oblita]